MKALRWFAILALLSAPSLRAADELFDLKQVVPGVYAAIAKEQYKVNCNAAVILLDDSVLVVDTHSKPSAARALQAQIKTITDKPVRFVVNTHFHWDHYRGNQVYLDTWPKDVQIISSQTTRENIEKLGIPRVKYEIATLPKDIEKLEADLAKATDPQQEATLQENLRQAKDYLEELKSMRNTLPTLTFDRSLILYQKSRIVEILWLGRAHTDGDVFVYLPKEKVIATGDALQGWMPWMNDGYPYEWVKTLENAERLDFDYVIGGHGDVMRGKAQFELWKSYISDLMAETADVYSQGASMAEAEKRVAAKLQPQYANKFPPHVFENSVTMEIQKAYRVISSSVE
jgi:glyoxylase-like metal-dependent hydrolase (beta-lactamase superfamily II)